MTTLRDRLRVDTAPWHERVDHVYSTLDLQRRDDLGTFLAAQRAVLGAIRLRPSPHAEEGRNTARRMKAARDANALFDLHVAARDRLAVLPEGSLHV